MADTHMSTAIRWFGLGFFGFAPFYFPEVRPPALT
jgi:hypothetical protein